MLSSAFEDARAHRHIPSLDGLRAIAIAFVCLSHGATNWKAQHGVGYRELLVLGPLGVQIFFVLSGFLITGLVLSELAKTQRINPARFYFRRTLRIFSAYFCYLSTVAFSGLVGVFRLDHATPLPAWTYTSDYSSTHSWLFAHTWSLSIEEQFYLLWPAALILGRRAGALKIAAAVVVACPILRILTVGALFQHHGYFAAHGILPWAFEFHTEADALATGSPLAGLHSWLRRQTLYMQVMNYAGNELTRLLRNTGNSAASQLLRTRELSFAVRDVLGGRSQRNERRHCSVPGLLYSP